MDSPYPDARSWARDHSLANVPRLARLEGFAFQQHPEIVATLGDDGAAMARFARERERRRSPATRAGNAAILIVGLIAVLAPITGVAVYGDAPVHIAPTGPLDAHIAVPIAGVCFVIAALTQLVLWAVWLRQRALWSPLLLGFAVLTAVLAGFAAIGMPNSAARDGMPLGGWMLPVWLTLVIAAALAVAVVLRYRARAADPEPDAVPLAPTVSDRERARQAVAQLPEEEREAIQDDRDDALQILAERGLLDDDTLRRALDADLGTLFTLDPVREE
ncbi:hypothetical protein SAMN04489806_2197 [Paramicrobacterium humi]|uniref:Uncharacterized protein n=1 Tax=Paramicrobacterium humi TaxID=640635 RepID=A0A1H4NH81_9MICO|nr:hypothetical protein [Microbacterium humi]SEB94613.1 hypothetical protein SAMN04489806_2197 [Microbacterium humi]